MSHPPSYEELNALWEDHQGNQKRFTYNDLRVCSNTIAHFLDSLRIFPRCPRLAVADSRKVLQLNFQHVDPGPLRRLVVGERSIDERSGVTFVPEAIHKSIDEFDSRTSVEFRCQ